MSPDIGVAQEQPLLLLFRAFVQKRIQMVVGRIHFRPLNGLGISGGRSLIRCDRERLALRLVLVPVNGFGDFSGCDRIHSFARTSRNTGNIQKLRKGMQRVHPSHTPIAA
jgi:hypothetical protein